MPGIDELLVVEVRRAVCSTYAALRSARPMEQPAGYAVLTDDNVGTIFHQVVTAEEIARSRDPGFAFSATDWGISYGDDAFDGARRVLARMNAPDGDIDGHDERVFLLLVRSLLELKREGVLPDNLFLWVLSTDPGDRMERLMRDAARRLNSPEVYEGFCRSFFD